MNAKLSSKLLRQYPIHQSPLFKLLGKGQFEAVLGIKFAQIKHLLGPNNYHVWVNDRGREIQQPIKLLAQVHARIGNLLGRIALPDYVFSKKGRSYAGNAFHHLGNSPLGKTDINKFYLSTTHEMVRRMFVTEFQCAGDLSRILADICCYQQRHLPTGSAISGRIAFFSARKMFDEISELAQATGSRMTVYVDDVTLSGPIVTKRLISEVRRVVRRHGLKTKQSKTKTFPAYARKTVTGVIIAGNELRLPNKRHEQIWKGKRAIQAALPHERTQLLRVLNGRLQQAKQILGLNTPGNMRATQGNDNI